MTSVEKQSKINELIDSLGITKAKLARKIGFKSRQSLDYQLKNPAGIDGEVYDKIISALTIPTEKNNYLVKEQQNGYVSVEDFEALKEDVKQLKDQNQKWIDFAIKLMETLEEQGENNKELAERNRKLSVEFLSLLKMGNKDAGDMSSQK